jgi:drug/metabolite transporter (DMT)-like permease
MEQLIDWLLPERVLTYESHAIVVVEAIPKRIAHASTLKPQRAQTTNCQQQHCSRVILIHHHCRRTTIRSNQMKRIRIICFLIKLQLFCVCLKTQAFVHIQTLPTAPPHRRFVAYATEKENREPEGTTDLLLVSDEKSLDLKLGLEDMNKANEDNNIQTIDFSSGLLSSIFLLNCVAIIWGTQHAVIKNLINDTSPSSYSLLRFGLAALIASPYTPGLPNRTRKTSDSEIQLGKAWRWGLELGLWMFLGFSLQAIGLETTTASRSGFLLYLNVKFVPFFSWLIFGKSISAATWLSAFAAFFGTALLATDGQSNGFNIGDLWSIAAAASSAMFILRLEKASAEVEQSSQLNAACLLVVMSLSFAWAFAEGDLTLAALSDVISSHPLELLYLGGVTTALSNYIQTLAQKTISAERASIIYSLDPVYGAFFSWLLLNETLGGSQAYIGKMIDSFDSCFALLVEPLFRLMSVC